MLQAVSADAAALIAQELGYEVSGDELLRFSGKASGVTSPRFSTSVSTTKTVNSLSEVDQAYAEAQTRLEFGSR